MAQVRGYSCLCWFSLWLWHHSLSGAISYKSHIMISLFGHKWLVLFPDARLHLSQGIICMCAKLMQLSHCHTFRNVINIAIYAAKDHTVVPMCTDITSQLWLVLDSTPTDHLQSVWCILLSDLSESESESFTQLINSKIQEWKNTTLAKSKIVYFPSIQ